MIHLGLFCGKNSVIVKHYDNVYNITICELEDKLNTGEWKYSDILIASVNKAYAHLKNIVSQPVTNKDNLIEVETDIGSIYCDKHTRLLCSYANGVVGLRIVSSLMNDFEDEDFNFNVKLVGVDNNEYEIQNMNNTGYCGKLYYLEIDSEYITINNIVCGADY